MNSRALISFRANVVLLSISTCIAMVPCFGIAKVSCLLPDGAPQWPWQACTWSVALVVMMLLRMVAKRAFRRAFRAGKLERRNAPSRAVHIADDCRHAWLVQLYLELQGQHCAD